MSVMSLNYTLYYVTARHPTKLHGKRKLTFILEAGTFTVLLTHSVSSGPNGNVPEETCCHRPK
uniref:Uncharacterized protein n=1 Tax=Anguilla anguilla TaxID=7936 RepID=A0A0E9WQK7_ANGAN